MTEEELAELLKRSHVKVSEDSSAGKITDMEPAAGCGDMEKKENPRFDSPVNIHVHSIGNRLADPDGISAKAAIDGIVKAGVLRDDSAKEVQKVSYSQEKGKEEKTIITITEA